MWEEIPQEWVKRRLEYTVPIVKNRSEFQNLSLEQWPIIFLLFGSVIIFQSTSNVKFLQNKTKQKQPTSINAPNSFAMTTQKTQGMRKSDFNIYKNSTQLLLLCVCVCVFNWNVTAWMTSWGKGRLTAWITLELTWDNNLNSLGYKFRGREFTIQISMYNFYSSVYQSEDTCIKVWWEPWLVRTWRNGYSLTLWWRVIWPKPLWRQLRNISSTTKWNKTKNPHGFWPCNFIARKFHYGYIWKIITRCTYKEPHYIT